MNVNDLPSISRAIYDRADRLRKELILAGSAIEEYANDELQAFVQAAMPIVAGSADTTASVSNGQVIATSNGGSVTLTVADGAITSAVYTAPAG